MFPPSPCYAPVWPAIIVREAEPCHLADVLAAVCPLRLRRRSQNRGGRPMTFVYDYDRLKRLGMPEAIFCQGKDIASLSMIIHELKDRTDHPVLLTRLSSTQYETLDISLSSVLDYEPVSATAILNGTMPPRPGRVAIVTAGTADLRVAREAQRTLNFSGVVCSLIVDVGVAGLWRLLDRIDDIRSHDVVIAVAGMDAAMASVVAGLVGKCIIGVPTSVGQGVLVTNIDNGFGAACGAIRILSAMVGVRPAADRATAVA